MDVSHASGAQSFPKRALESWLARLLTVFAALFCAFPAPLNANDANASGAQLSQRIDSVLHDNSLAVPLPPADPAMLAGRLYLDLCGMRPTIQQLNSYLASTDANRFQTLVDQLIASPEFSEHWAEKLDVMLMERRPNTHVPQDQWTAWLRTQIATDRPLQQWLADLISADGYPADQRPAARFLLDRAADPHLITRDIGRIYFGRDFQCAQCHDHPAIDSYLQSDYHGLLGFVGSIGLVEATEGDKKIQVIVEKSASEAAFESVFARGKFRRVLPMLPASDETTEPISIPGEDYLPPATAGYPQRPVNSRRVLLANAIRSGQQQEFNRNLANRIFGLVFGRGVVEPMDLIHDENPPLHPELLDILSEDLQRSNFSLKAFVRQLVLSQTYQLGEPPIRYETTPAENAATMVTAAARPEWFSANVERAKNLVVDLEAKIIDLNQQVDAKESEYEAALTAFEPVENERVQAMAAIDAARTTYSQALDAKSKTTTERDTAASAVNVLNDKISKLNTASEATTAAVAAVGEDAELNNALAVLKQKAEKLNGELPSLQQALDAKQQALDAAATKAAADRDALNIAQTAFTVVNEKHAVARQVLLSTRNSFEALKTSRTQLGSYKRAAADFVELESIYATIDGLNAQRQSLQSTFDAAEQKVAAAKAQQTATETQLTQIVSSQKAAEVAHQQASDNLAMMQQRIQTLNSAAESLKVAATTVANPARLSDATAEISESLLALSQQLSGLDQQHKSTQQALIDANNQVAMQQAKMTEATALVASSQAEVVQAQESLKELDIETEKQQSLAMKGLEQIESMLGGRLLAKRLTPLMPEQMAWSFLNVTGIYDRYVDKHLAELEKQSPATEEQKQDAVWLAERRAKAIRLARAELQGNINHFVTLYGAGAGQPQNDFFATADQALYASNGGSIFAWASPAANNVTEQMAKAPDNTEAAKLLYLGVLCRNPTQLEISTVDQFLGNDANARNRLSQELVWGLMAGAEFRFKN